MDKWLVEYKHSNSGYLGVMEVTADDVKFCMGALVINKEIMINLDGLKIILIKKVGD